MEETFAKIKEKISPDRYHEIAKSIELMEISLIELNTKVNRSKLKELTDLKLRINDEYEIGYSDNAYRLLGKITLDIPIRGRGENPLVIKAVFSARFHSSEDIIEEFWVIYKELVFRFQIWPYFRELVQSITARMNIPPLTLPVISSQ